MRARAYPKITPWAATSAKKKSCTNRPRKAIDTKPDWVVSRTDPSDAHWGKREPTQSSAMHSYISSRTRIEYRLYLTDNNRSVTRTCSSRAACVVQNKVRASSAWGFDVSALLGFFRP